jgi:PAS domain S-box-containing protein
MQERYSTKDQLIEKLMDMRRRVTEFEETIGPEAWGSIENSSLRLLEMLDKSNQAYLLIRHGRFEFLNRACVEMFGYSHVEWSSLPSLFEKVIHPDDQEMIRKYYANRTGPATSHHRYVCRIICKDGSLKWLDIQSSSILWKDEPAFLAVATDITQYIELQKSLEEKTHSLAKRVKELDCLNRISELIHNSVLSPPQIFDNIVDLIPQAWQYPEITCAEICVGDDEYRTGNHDACVFKQSEKIIVDGADVGAVRVGYLEKRMESDEGPFLNEERNLIKAIAKNIGQIILRKRTDDEIRDREQRFRAISDSVFDPIILVDDKAEICFWNKAAERIFGYSSSEAMSKNVHELLAPSLYHQAAFSGFKDFTQTGRGNATGEISELIARRKDGEEFPIELSLSSFQMHGRWFASGIVRDISERKRSEEQIKLNETRLQSLYEISQYRAKTIQDFLDFTLDHVIRLTGSKVGYIYYYDADKRQFILNTWSKDVMKQCEVVEPQTVYELEKTGIWGEAVRQKTAIIINNFQAFNPLKKGYPSGHVELLKFMTTPIFQDGNIVAVVGVANKKSDYDEADVRQVSLLMDSVWRMIDRRQAAERERLLSTAVEQAAESVIITDASGIIQYTNPTAETISGYSSDELIGRTANILKSGKQDDFFYKALWETINAGRMWSGRFINKKKDGTEYQEDASISPVYDKSGKLTNFVAVKRDVTKEIELQEQLFHAQKLESLGVMAGGIAHDFNNLLQVVLGNLDIALDDIPPDSEARQSILNAIKASERSAELSGQMLTYAGSALYLPKDIYLDDLLNKTKSLLQSSISRHVALDFDICKTLPHIEGEPNQIQRLICALAVNASEAIGANAGGVTIRTGVMDCDEAYLSHSHLEKKPESGRFVFLEVSDTGCGMDAETQRKLFDPFFSTKFWGRGLGMAEVMGIVKGHHGAIMVDSEVGKGTTIRVLFSAPQQAPTSTVHPMEAVETQPAVSYPAVLLGEEPFL